MTTTYFQSFIGSEEDDDQVQTRPKKSGDVNVVLYEAQTNALEHRNDYPSAETSVDDEREYSTNTNGYDDEVQRDVTIRDSTNNNGYDDEVQRNVTRDDESGNHYDETGNYYDEQYQEYEQYENEDPQLYVDDVSNKIDCEKSYNDWRSLQQKFLLERMNQKSSRSGSMRDQSPMGQRQGLDSEGTKRINMVGDRLYSHAREMKRRHDSRIKAKQYEEAQIKPKLELATKRSNSNLRSISISRSESNATSSSTPRYQHLYAHGMIMNKKKQAMQKEKDFEMKQRKLRLESRPSSRARQATSVPRYMHLYERAKAKKEQETLKINETEVKQVVRKNVTTPQRIDRLYALSGRSQQEGKQRRERIEKEKKEQRVPPPRSESVGRREITQPLDVRLYNRGLAQMKKMEMKRAEAAAERDDDSFKSPFLSSKISQRFQ